MFMDLENSHFQTLNIDEQELQSRLEFFQITDEDASVLASLRPFAQKYTKVIVDQLYELILNFFPTKVFFPDEVLLKRVQELQCEYFIRLFSGKYDLDYVRDRLKVGAAHERIGLPPKWYFGAYRRYLQIIHDFLLKELQDNQNHLQAAMKSIKKIIFFDMALANDTYMAAHVESMTRHQAAIRELSTPVIKVYEKVLLLPLVGTVDTQRAHQIMEKTLLKVVEEQAKVIIIDIAGVPLVDTKVADHLLKTTAAIRLLGAQTILTGISAQIAQTIVHLGVDTLNLNMETRARLSDGIELALTLIGKRIQGVSSFSTSSTASNMNPLDSLETST